MKIDEELLQTMLQLSGGIGDPIKYWHHGHYVPNCRVYWLEYKVSETQSFKDIHITKTFEKSLRVIVAPIDYSKPDEDFFYKRCNQSISGLNIIRQNILHVEEI